MYQILQYKYEQNVNLFPLLHIYHTAF